MHYRPPRIDHPLNSAVCLDSARAVSTMSDGRRWAVGARGFWMSRGVKP